MSLRDAPHWDARTGERDIGCPQSTLRETLCHVHARVSSTPPPPPSPLPHPQGQLKYNGRTLQHTDTPASALDGEDVWAEAQESNEEPLVMVDFVVPATG